MYLIIELSIHWKCVQQRYDKDISMHTLMKRILICNKIESSDYFKGININGYGKIESIVNWPTPKNVTDVRSFMGLIGYYWRFIEGLAKVAHPITSLQNKGIQFYWKQKCEEIF